MKYKQPFSGIEQVAEFTFDDNYNRKSISNNYCSDLLIFSKELAE